MLFVGTLRSNARAAKIDFLKKDLTMLCAFYYLMTMADTGGRCFRPADNSAVLYRQSDAVKAAMFDILGKVPKRQCRRQHMNYGVTARKNPQDKKSPAKFYPRPIYGKTWNLAALTDEISHSTSLTPADVHATISELVGFLKRRLVEGDRVKLDGLGTFKISFGGNGNGKEKAEDVSAQDIGGARIAFAADPQLRRYVKAITRFGKQADPKAKEVTEETVSETQ